MNFSDFLGRIMEFEIYKDERDEYRWRLWDNSEIIAASQDGFDSYQEALDEVERVKLVASRAGIK